VYGARALRGSLLSMRFIYHLYRELGLALAAKYYSLATASVALVSYRLEVKPVISQGLVDAAESDYYQGSWVGFLDLAEVGLRAYGLFSKESKDLDDDELQRYLFDLATLMTMAKLFDERLFERIAKRVENWNLDDMLKKSFAMAQSAWEKTSIPEIWKNIEEQIGGRPFGDLGKVREVVWSELGITWKVSWKNDYDTTAASEQLIAILQILLSDLGGIDLCLLKTDVEVDVCALNFNSHTRSEGASLAEPSPFFGQLLHSTWLSRYETVKNRFSGAAFALCLR